MHLHFERNTNAKCDCSILFLTWMGKVPDEVPEDEGWKLNRVNYYQEGWLATGNARGIVGITFTTSHCQQPTDSPLRTNYNLRGHRSQVVLVKWNEPYQKLASCDSSGIIFVWVKYEGRWSIELINDRNTPVTHFSWSHDGRMALICYKDGFVLVGSVGGQRYWSSMLNLEATITCGLWTPDDQQVYFGTSSGHIIVMDVTGAMVSQVAVEVGPHIGITGMAWSCEKFKMEESDDASHNNAHPDGRPFVLAVSMECGIIMLLKHYDDLSPIQIQTYLVPPVVMEWSNSGQVLAVAGVAATNTSPGQLPLYLNVLKFYSDSGKLLYSVTIPCRQWPVTALTWGHNDKRLFIATGREVHIAWVSRRIASLQMLCRLRIHKQLRGGETQLAQLMLPPQVHDGLAQLFSRTIRCCVPDSSALRDFVSEPPKGNVRLHCTMIRHDEDGSCYTLYLEYLGGLVPLLKGKRTSKIRPEFVIFDPLDETSANIGECRFAVTALPASVAPKYTLNGSSTSGTSGTSSAAATTLSVLSPYRNDFEESDSEREEGCVSPRMQRKCQRARARARFRFGNGLGRGLSPELTYVDTLPEDHTLVQVTSNIWGTKFKIHGLAGGTMPVNLGHITYKTSLLHLQPRQMTVCVTEMRPDLPASLTNDPNFNPNVFSEDEEEAIGEANGQCMPVPDICPPIAPMLTPRNPRKVSRGSASGASGSTSAETTNHIYQPTPVTRADVGTQARSNIGINIAALARAESYTDDEFPYPSFNEPLQRPVADSIRLGCAAPALQSPKNSVAPLVSAPTAPDYSVNMHRLKTVLEGAGNVNPCQHYLFQADRSDDFNDRKSTLSAPSDNLQACGATPAATASSASGAAAEAAALPSGSQTLASLELRFIDDESHEVRVGPVRSCSVGFLNQVTTGAPVDTGTTKRLVLTTRKLKERTESKSKTPVQPSDSATANGHTKTRQCSKSRSLDAFPGKEIVTSRPSTSIAAPTELHTTDEASEAVKAETPPKAITNGIPSNPDANNLPEEPPNTNGSVVEPEKAIVPADEDVNSNDCNRTRTESTLTSTWPGGKSPKRRSPLANATAAAPNRTPQQSSPRLPRSTPSSPATCKRSSGRNLSSSPIKQCILNSPLLLRRIRRNKSATESTDDEDGASGDDHNYSDLETFQKAQLRQKLKRGKHKKTDSKKDFSSSGSTSSSNSIQKRAEFVMHNKAPMWNENSQVYQLDFGGRVTQESAKNFQIEFRSKQVMQFGRIDGNAYTLDFQYPFSALQAFAVALANVTQRLK